MNKNSLNPNIGSTEPRQSHRNCDISVFFGGGGGVGGGKGVFYKMHHLSKIEFI